MDIVEIEDNMPKTVPSQKVSPLPIKIHKATPQGTAESTITQAVAKANVKAAQEEETPEEPSALEVQPQDQDAMDLQLFEQLEQQVIQE